MTSPDPRTASAESLLKQQRLALGQTFKRKFADRDARTYAAGNVPDSAELAAADVAADSAMTELSGYLEELRRIDAALARIAAGTYGRCSDCGAAIPQARLAVEPAALRCATCETRFENRHREARDRTPSL